MNRFGFGAGDEVKLADGTLGFFDELEAVPVSVDLPGLVRYARVRMAKRDGSPGNVYRTVPVTEIKHRGVSPHKRSRTAPTDAAAGAAWDQIMKLATDHCLIVQAAGGSATLATPSVQRTYGRRNEVLTAHDAYETEEREA